MVSHPRRKNKDAPRVGHPALVQHQAVGDLVCRPKSQLQKSTDGNADPSTPFGAKSAPNSAQDDSLSLNVLVGQNTSNTTVWICNIPGLRSETWGTQTVMGGISKSHGHGTSIRGLTLKQQGLTGGMDG